MALAVPAPTREPRATAAPILAAARVYFITAPLRLPRWLLGRRRALPGRTLPCRPRRSRCREPIPESLAAAGVGSPTPNCAAGVVQRPAAAGVRSPTPYCPAG